MRFLYKRSGLFSALALAIGLLLTACGDNTNTPVPATTAASTTVAASTAVATTTATTTTVAATTVAATTSAPTTAATTIATTVAATTAATTVAATTAPATTQAATTAATTAPAKLSTPVKLTFALDWVPNTNHTGIYVALQKGWYKDAGIDLQLLPYADGAIPDVLVGEGKADLGISGEDGVATYHAAGQPVVSLAAIIQHNTSGFAFLKDSGIKRPRDLAGKRYAGFGAAYEEPVIAAMIRNDGGIDTKIQNITTSVGGYQAVAAKQADFVWIFAGWDGIQAKLDKVDLDMFYLKDHGVPDFYTPVIISSQQAIQNKKEALKVFMAVTARGYDYAIANPKDAADLLIAANPKGTFTNTDLVYQSQEYLSPKYKEDAPKWGVQTLKAWSEYPKFLFDNGVLQGPNGRALTKELDYSTLFTNDFLP